MSLRLSNESKVVLWSSTGDFLSHSQPVNPNLTEPEPNLSAAWNLHGIWSRDRMPSGNLNIRMPVGVVWNIVPPQLLPSVCSEMSFLEAMLTLFFIAMNSGNYFIFYRFWRILKIFNILVVKNGSENPWSSLGCMIVLKIFRNNFWYCGIVFGACPRFVLLLLGPVCSLWSRCLVYF